MDIVESRGDIKKVIEEISKEQQIEDYVVTNVSTNKKGDGFFGQFLRVSIKDSTSDKHLDIAIKAAFTDENVRKMMPIQKLYKNEIDFYLKVQPLFQQFETDHSIENVPLIPKCYKVSMEEGSEILALEDLKAAGFEMYNKKSFLDHEHTALIFKTYGRFHGHSFALRDQWPEEYKRVATELFNFYMESMQGENSFIRHHFKILLEQIPSYLTPGEDDDLIRKFQEYGVEGLLNCYEKLIVDNCEYTAILHGDSWCNNIMFKYEETDNGRKLTDIRLLDWQMTKVGNPVCDLSYLLYSGASKDILDRLDEYLKIYYESFSTFLRQLGSNPEKLFSFEALKQQWKQFSKFGMIMGLSMLKMKMTADEDFVDLTDEFDPEDLSAVIQKTKFDTERYKKAVRGLLRHMIEIDAF